MNESTNDTAALETHGRSDRGTSAALGIALSALLLGACGPGSNIPDTGIGDANQPAEQSGTSSAEQGHATPVELGAATPDVGASGSDVSVSGISGGSNTGAEPPANLAPQIVDTSYNCDPVVDSVAFEAGQSDSFTLSVTDESPLTLTYAADSSSLETVDVSVDENGIFTLSALQAGESYLWLTATDANGLADEYELRVVVE